MQAVREITHWKDVKRQPNHVYLLEGDRVLAYIKFGEGPVEWLSGKIKIDRRGRKFEPADIKRFDRPQQEAVIEDWIYEVKGSKGNSYFVDRLEKTCTCPGYTFRGECKHIKEIA